MIESFKGWEICRLERTVRPTPDGADPGGWGPTSASLWYRRSGQEAWIRSSERSIAKLRRHLDDMDDLAEAADAFDEESDGRRWIRHLTASESEAILRMFGYEVTTDNAFHDGQIARAGLQDARRFADLLLAAVVGYGDGEDPRSLFERVLTATGWEEDDVDRFLAIRQT